MLIHVEFIKFTKECVANAKMEEQRKATYVDKKTKSWNVL